MTATVSVIIPVFNGEEFLSEAIQSALMQTHRPLEVIVVNDGSTDGSVKVARTFSEVHLIDGEHNGVSAARNQGVQAAKGDWLAFLDADDTWMPDKLSEQLALGQGGRGLVMCRYAPVFHREKAAWYAGPTEDESADCYFPSAWLVRRELFEAVGGFDPGWTHGEDFEWLSRAIRAGATLAVVQEVLVRRRIHAANASKASDPRRIVFDIIRFRRRRGEGQVQ